MILVRTAVVRALSLGVVSLWVVGSAWAQSHTLFIQDGKVGIGEDNPLFPLHVVDITGPGGKADVLLRLENNGPPRIDQTDTNTGVTFRQTVGQAGPTRFYRIIDLGDPAQVELELTGAGNLIITGALTTATNSYPDYVFDDSYELMPLPDLANFIETHGHLPNVPSAEVTEGGLRVNMSELQVRLLEKVEELTLYTLQQERRLEQQQALIENLQRRLAKLGELEAKNRAD